MKCLLPVDGSECSRRAVEDLARLARRVPSLEVCLLHVCPPAEGWEVHSFLSDEEIAELQECAARQGLKEAGDLLDAVGLAYRAEARVGPVAETIARYADEQGCDFIVMGTHGRGGLSRLLMGSVASEVVHLAKVPVTLVK